MCATLTSTHTQVETDRKTSPDISVILLTPDCFETIRKTVRHLRAQSVHPGIELILVAPSAKDLAVDRVLLEGFFGYRVVEVGPITNTAEARAAGIRAASAPVVALVEDHSYPAPGWAEGLINAHQRPWAAVGPMMANGNPRTATSWANLLIEYGPWLEPQQPGIRDHLPGHNSSYKRDLLLSYGQRLPAMLRAESILHWDLRAKGHQLYLEPSARTFHFNFSSVKPSVALRFQGGRLFAAARSREWSVPRWLVFILVAPLIPFVRLLRILPEWARRRHARGAGIRVLPALVAGLVIDGCGEMVGYATGAGDSMERLSEMEFHRRRYVAKVDQHLWEE